ncbi:hypothetical protein M409DRAFT_31622, partial [Zasmidium cellare ATCC 36951]
PLSRAAIISRNDGVRRDLVWTAHHSVYDGWSINKMTELLARLIQGETRLAPVPASRFIAYLSRQDQEKTTAFWRTHLQDASWSRFPPLPSPQYSADPRDLLHSQLNVSQISGEVTTPTILRAAWALLVSTYTGAEESVTSIVLSGRMAPVEGITDLVAPTVTSVPFRVSTSRDRSVRDFLADVQDRAIEMIPYEHTGIQNIRRIVPDLGPEFDPGHSFIVQPAEESEMATSIPYTELERSTTSGNAFDAYPLTVECTMGLKTNTVGIELSYDRKVVAPGDAQRLLTYFDHFVQELSRNAEADQSLEHLQLQLAEDKAQLCKWNSVMPPRIERCIHDLVGEQITARPAATAISAWDGEMTYGELDDASRRLAHHL